MHNRLQVGIDFCQKRADLCLLFPDGQPLESHIAFDNSYLGYSGAKQLLLDALDEHAFDGIDVSGEATGYLWLPFFLQLAADPELELHDLRLHLLNPRWVKWFKKCFAQDDKTDEKDSYYIAERTRTRRPDLGPLTWASWRCGSTLVCASTWSRIWPEKSVTFQPSCSSEPVPIAASSPSQTSLA
jgi:hypothetical protein